MAICILAAGPVLLTVNNTPQEKNKNLTLQEAVCSHLFVTILWVCYSKINIFSAMIVQKINFLSFHYTICGHVVGSSEGSKCSNMHLGLQNSHNLLPTSGKNCSVLWTVECAVYPSNYPQQAGLYMPYGLIHALYSYTSYNVGMKQPMQRQIQRCCTIVLGGTFPLLPVSSMPLCILWTLWDGLAEVEPSTLSNKPTLSIRVRGGSIVMEFLTM